MEGMNVTAVITGGSIDLEYLQGQRLEEASFLICADHGLEAADALGLTPDLLVGDFDSVDTCVLERYLSQAQTEVVRFNPEKDATDTELALKFAVQRGSDEIRIYGGFGTRLDHTLANIALLKQLADQDIPAVLCDPLNQIRMICKNLIICKDKAFGMYVSLLPYGGAARGVTLRGFRYPLEHAIMEPGSSLGISNEIIDEEAVIEIEKGYLLVMESRDGNDGK